LEKPIDGSEEFHPWQSAQADPAKIRQLLADPTRGHQQNHRREFLRLFVVLGIELYEHREIFRGSGIVAEW